MQYILGKLDYRMEFQTFPNNTIEFLGSLAILAQEIADFLNQ